MSITFAKFLNQTQHINHDTYHSLGDTDDRKKIKQILSENRLLTISELDHQKRNLKIKTLHL